MHKVLLHVSFASDDGDRGFARLECELPFAPTIEIELEHPVWHEARKPASVSYNLETRDFYVHIGADRVNASSTADHAEMYRLHGWDVTSH